MVFMANLLGAAAFATLAVLIGPALGVIDSKAFGDIARPLVAHSGPMTLASAVLAAG